MSCLFFTASKEKKEFLLCRFKKGALYITNFVKVMINIGNRTSCRPIRSIILLVIKQIGLLLRGCPSLLITRMITDRVGLRSVLLPLLIKMARGR